MEGPVEAEAEFFMPIPTSWSKKKQAQAQHGEILPITKPDVDNVMKAIMDACEGVVYHRDSQVVRKVVSKVYSDHPRSVVLFRQVC